MRIGVISEGHADRAVITNIIKGITGLDEVEIKALLPIEALDETDKSIAKKVEEFGGWTSVKNECEKKNIIDDFLAIEGQDYIVIHLDTAEASEYGIKNIPEKDEHYAKNLRNMVVDQIDDWISDQDVIKRILHAVAVEEIDAWLLTIYGGKKDTSKSADPKKTLSFVLGKNGINSASNFVNYLKLSRPFSKPKEVIKYKFHEFNYSLKAFFEEVEDKTKNH